MPLLLVVGAVAGLVLLTTALWCLAGETLAQSWRSSQGRCAASSGHHSLSLYTYHSFSPLLPVIYLVSDSGGSGHAVYSYDLPPYPYTCLRDMSASQWSELACNPIVLEARAIKLALADLLANSRARQLLKGAQVCWVSDNQQLIMALATNISGRIARNTKIAEECGVILLYVRNLQMSVQWQWSSRQRPAIQLAHRLCKVAADDPPPYGLLNMYRASVIADLASLCA